MLNDDFLEKLASASPTPGGGGASAAVGAVATSLASMVANITANNKKYASVHGDMQRLLGDLDGYRRRLLHLVELDAKAFEPISQAFKMPADTPSEIAERNLALQSALVQGCDVPLDIMCECAEVLDICKTLARKGSHMALADVAAAAVFCRAAVLGAALNIYVNAGWMTDQQLSVHYVSRAEHISREAEQLSDEIYAFVLESIR